MTEITSKQPSAQVEPAKKAARLKATNQAKQPQHPWLQQQVLLTPASDVPPVTPERIGEAHLSQGPPRGREHGLRGDLTVPAVEGGGSCDHWRHLSHDLGMDAQRYVSALTHRRGQVDVVEQRS